MEINLLQWLWSLPTDTILATWVALIGGYGIAIALLPRILNEQRTAGAAWAWLLLVFLIPHIGVVLYILFGGRHLRMVQLTCPDLSVPAVEGPEAPEPYRRLAVNLTRSGGAPVLCAERLDYISDGVVAFERLLGMIRGAQRSVEVCVFMLHRDAAGAAVVEALAERARAGVTVRLLLDAGGSMLVRGSYTDPIREAGGQVAAFLPLLPRRGPWSFNMRNHRKIIVVDDEQALIGGMNFGLMYMGPEPDPDRWQDMMLWMSGPVVAAVRTLFEEDWHIAAGEHRDVEPPPACSDGLPVQILGDGPVFYEEAYSRMVLAAARLAKHTLRLVTPYYVPDQALHQSLITAAQTGVCVELIVPLHSNHPSADHARRPFLRDLVREGVVVLAFEGGMVHGKCGVIDGEVSWVSSANLDMRSITFNFEVSAVVWDRGESAHVEGWFEELRQRSRRLTPEDVASSGLRRVGEDVLRLLAPML